MNPLNFALQDSCPQTVTQIGKREELMYNPIRVNDITWNFEVGTPGPDRSDRFLSEIPNRRGGTTPVQVGGSGLGANSSTATDEYPFWFRFHPTAWSHGEVVQVKSKKKNRKINKKILGNKVNN